MRSGLETPQIRQPAVAGSFYPRDAAALRGIVEECLAQAARTREASNPKALIAPHAGYVYSGPIAANAYVKLLGNGGGIRRVVLMGPSHFVPLNGLALSSASAFQTPLGSVRLDSEFSKRILDLPYVQTLDAAHSREHSLEVHLPFLQMVLQSFTLVPLVVGRATPQEVAEVLERLWNGAETLVVISSDLSHYHPYEKARELDSRTCGAILGLEPSAIGPAEACGCHPINGLIEIARTLSMRGQCLDLRNSGDTAGDKNRVVGYGSFIFG